MSTENASSVNEELALRRQLLTLWEKMADQITPLFLRRQVLVPELEKILRWRATNAALNNPEFAIPSQNGDQQHYSHSAVVTGLSRQEMARAGDEKINESPVPLDGGSLHRMIRILTAWRTDPGYQDENGNPIDLPLHSSHASFDHLCRLYGRDTPTSPIAKALVRNGNAEWISDSAFGKREKWLRYVHPVVSGGCRTPEDIEILTQIAADFLHSLQTTLSLEAGMRPRFREGYYSDIDAELAETALEELHVKIQEFNVDCTEILKKYRTTQPGKPVVRLGVGSYSFRHAPLYLETSSTDENQQTETTTEVKK